MCFTCKCVTGHTKPCGCFMLYNCSSDCGWKTGNKTIMMTGEDDNYCNSTVLPAGECSIKATDADAWDDINTIPLFTLNNITTNNNQTSTCSSSTCLSSMTMATSVVTAIMIAGKLTNSYHVLLAVAFHSSHQIHVLRAQDKSCLEEVPEHRILYYRSSICYSVQLFGQYRLALSQF